MVTRLFILSYILHTKRISKYHPTSFLLGFGGFSLIYPTEITDTTISVSGVRTVNILNFYYLSKYFHWQRDPSAHTPFFDKKNLYPS